MTENSEIVAIARLTREDVRRVGASLKLVLKTEDTPQFLEHLLINGELDVAIMVSNALSEPQAMVCETLTRSPNRVWLPSNHAQCAQDELSLADCAACDQIVLEADRIGDLMVPVWGRHQLKPRVILRTSSLEAVRSLVGAGAASPCCRIFSTGPGPWTPSMWRCGRCAMRCPPPTWAWCGGAGRG